MKERKMLSCLKLILVTNIVDQPKDQYFRFIEKCVFAGVTAVQLRRKNTPYKVLLEFGRELRSILLASNTPLIVNDDLRLAADLDADGIHLGQTDGCTVLARQLLGPNKLIGLSTDSFANIQEANQLPIDYIGVGAIFPTQNKSNVSTIWGIEKLKQAVDLSKHPVVAIGGINESNIQSVANTGVYGVAGIGMFHDAKKIM